MILYNSKENIKSLLFYLSEKTGAGCHANTWPVQECVCVLCLWDIAFCICDLVFLRQQLCVRNSRLWVLLCLGSGRPQSAEPRWGNWWGCCCQPDILHQGQKKLQILLLFLYIRYLSLSEATDKVAIVNQIFHIKGNSAVVNFIFASNYTCVCVCVCGGGRGT